MILKADYTPQNAFGKWPDFWKWVQDLAAVRGITTDEVKIIGPSENGSHIFQNFFIKITVRISQYPEIVASHEKAMLWAEEFYFNIPENIRVDAINVHDYMVNGGTQGVDCKCNAELLRDLMSHYKQKFGLPIWLTEFNCGNGWWDCPDPQHYQYMQDTLPMLEEMPWVVRYRVF